MTKSINRLQGANWTWTATELADGSRHFIATHNGKVTLDVRKKAKKKKRK